MKLWNKDLKDPKTFSIALNILLTFTIVIYLLGSYVGKSNMYSNLMPGGVYLIKPSNRLIATRRIDEIQMYASCKTKSELRELARLTGKNPVLYELWGEQNCIIVLRKKTNAKHDIFLGYFWKEQKAYWFSERDVNDFALINTIYKASAGERFNK